jgi:hypothetical protein
VLRAAAAHKTVARVVLISVLLDEADQMAMQKLAHMLLTSFCPGLKPSAS